MFIAGIITIATIWKQSSDKWIKKCFIYIYTHTTFGIILSRNKKGEIISLAAT